MPFAFSLQNPKKKPTSHVFFFLTGQEKRTKKNLDTRLERLTPALFFYFFLCQSSKDI